jgi:hypothetical protein
MRHLIADGWQSLRHEPAWRRAFCARHLGAGATSLAIHAAVVGAVVWLSAHSLGVGAAGVAGMAAKRTTRLLALLTVSPTATSNATAPGERPAKKPLLHASKDTGPAEVGIPMEPGESTLTFPGFTLDVEKVLRRRTALFPFLTQTLTFSIDERREERPTSLVNPFATQSRPVREPPLVLSEAEVRRLVDDAWARRERWGPFQRIRALIDVHNPDVGQVPALLRGYVDQNALQPYVEARIRDPRIWAQLELAADHELFLEFIADYVSRHPHSRASVELLFLLDNIAQGSLDTLQTLTEIDPDRDLRSTRRMNAAAFDAIVEVRDYYVAQRERRGLGSRSALGRHYDQIRTQILTAIVKTAPDDYRVNDARYLLGEIHWRRGRHADAKRAWSQMRADPHGRYAEARASLIRALRDSASRRLSAPPPDARRRRPAWMRDDGGNSDIEQREIHAILEAEYQRWVSFSRARLQRFGYALDSF